LIDVLDQQLEAWVQEQLGRVSVSLLPPPQEQGVSLYLMGLDSAPPMRGNVRSPLRIALHYLVTCWDSDPLKAHAQLSELLFAAIEHPDYDVVFEPINYHLWQNLGIAPQPSFVLRALASKERPEAEVPRVREPRVELVPAVALRGRILGPQDRPIVGAYVQLPSYQLSQRSNSRGEFSFPNVVGETVQLLVRAKGIERLVSVNRDEADPIIIRFESF
jgi:hypothetical protein